MRRGVYTLFLVLFAGIVLLSSCEKRDVPVILPPRGAALQSAVDMGEEYETQLYFDFESGQVVKTSAITLWDLAFEASPTGHHFFINGGKNLFVYNTHVTNPASFTSCAALTASDWVADAPCGLPDSTAAGEWMNPDGTSKNEIYILKFSDNTFKKFVVQGLDAAGYHIAFGDVNATVLMPFTIPKNEQYNYAHFSFDNNGIITLPEPPKANWDIVFTRYHYIYRSLNNFPYLVAGALLNPYNTTGAVDSLTGFESINLNSPMISMPFSNFRDIIGFEWKTYNFTTGRYEIDPTKTYLIRNRQNNVYKMKFLDFYNAQGRKGAPSFLFDRVQ